MVALNISIIGGGSWGTTLAHILSGKHDSVTLWVYEDDLAVRMRTSHVNDLYLPGIQINKDIKITSNLEAAVRDTKCIITVIPSHVLGGVLRQIPVKELSPDVNIISATKGIDNETLKFPVEIIRETTGIDKTHIGVLSGPTFAKELAKGKPAAATIAAGTEERAEYLQEILSTDILRLYRSCDIIGIEICGAVKNVLAIACGISDGMGLGDNARAALITRGLSEMRRLGEAMGAQPETFFTLAGVGDLVLTCCGTLSRNHQVGFRLGKGEGIDGIQASMRMIAEGVKTSRSLHNLKGKFNIDMPITDAVYRIVHEKEELSRVIKGLLARPLKKETE